MTPAIDFLKKNKCDFKILKYKHDINCTNFGKEAASKLELNENQVFKTLLVELTPKELVVGIIPVNCTLSLKDIAKIFQAKNAKMANKQEAQKVTGYLLGGISPFGQKKRLKTVINDSAYSYDKIYVSAGKRGLDIEIKPQYLEEFLSAKKAQIIA